MPSFDGDTLIITLDAGVTQVDTQADLYVAWKDFVRDQDAQGRRNSRFPPAFRTIGGDDLTPGIEAGAYFFIRNDLGWRIKPAEEDATILLTGNLAPEESSLPILIPTTGAFTVLVAGLQPITQSVAEILTQQQNALYDGEVTIDVANGVAGTAFPIGSLSSPVNNIADARTIASARNFRKYLVINGALLLDQNYDDWEFVGSGFNSSVDVNGQSVDNTVFREIIVGGTGSGAVVGFTCRLLSLTGIEGTFLDCGVLGTITAPTGGDLLFKDCTDAFAGVGTPTMILVPGGGTLQLRSWNGGVLIQGFTEAGHDGSFEMDPGRIVLDATNTAGSMLVRGQGQITDNSAGTTVDKTGFLEGVDLRTTRKILQNRTHTDRATGVETIFDDDDVTVLFTANIFEDAAGSTPYGTTSTEINRRNRLV